ncbi:cutinase [Moniliophthora roreri MCA 2997]|uniref:cutinase n=1 Tax=Moniliophthora roreri (strain MCA 2997) TaxID=1381753 RepID=V2XQP0_MONRO|nr:cutinase [Moniliophthora roreri MCA 2997]
MAPVERRATVQCADVMVFFARGTTEPAPIGTIVGPPLKAALQRELGSQTMSFQGVDYSANVAGFLQGGDKQGSRTMADDITNAANSCPNAKIVTAGYSQGGQLVHNSAELLSPDVVSRINAAVIFVG